MDRQYQQQQQYPSYNNNEGGGSAASSSSSSTTTPIAAGQKRTADQLTQDDNHDSFGDLGEGVEVKDEQETSQMGDASARTTAGNSHGKNKRTAAPPLKRGSACMLCRKRKLRCDGLRPKCGTCLRLSHECVYGDPAQEKIEAKTRELEDRIRSLEAELETYRSAETPAPQQQHHQPHLMNGSQFSDMDSVSPSSASTSRPPIDRTTSYQALNLANVDNQGFPSPLLNTPGGGGGGYAGFPAPPSGPPSSYPQHHQPLDSPYLAFSQHGGGGGGGDPSRPSPHHHNSFGRPDSEAFPLPPPQDGSNTNGFLSRLPIPGSSNNGGSPGHSPIGGGIHPQQQQQQAHLQSFPFPMNPTPQLSDLINPQHYSPVAPSYHQSNEDGSPVSIHQISPIVAANGGYGGGYGGLGIPSNGRQPFDGQSALASPERGLEDSMKKASNGNRNAGGELSTLWITADLPEIDLMVELANIYFQTIHQHLPFLHRPRFLYTLRHPASLSSPPSLSLIFAVLAIASAYHDSPQIRSLQTRWYASAREKVEVAIQAGIRPQGGRVASLTVEMVQALCLLALLEMGQSDHQRAFLSIGQAVRIAAMLGLHRMDEDRLSERCGGDKRLRPPALHELPTDGVLLEECRRTMCAVIVLDRFEQGCVGWPSAIAEPDLRILLPCDEALYESGICTSEDNPMWWPSGGLEAEDQETMKEGNERKRVGTFGWLCRVIWVGGRIQLETYRPSGPPAGGPWNKNVAMDPLFSTSDMLEMDKLLDFVRSKLGQMAAMKASQHKGVDGPVIMTLLLVNCLFVNLHHLRGASGLSQLPFDPNAPIFIGTAEYSMQRCWEAIHSLYEIVSQLAGYENAHTSLHQSKINTFTAFVPYVLYCMAFPAKFTIGDWTALVNSRDRTENVPAHLSRADIPRGDDVFPPAYFEQRLKMVDALCDAMERVGAVWPIGHKFSKMIAGDRIRLAERTYQRDHGHPNSAGGGSNHTTPASQSSQHLHPHHQQQQQQGYQTSPTTLHSDQGY